MPRKQLIRTNTNPYHVLNRVNNKEFYAPEIHQVWNIYQEVASLISFCFGARIHGLILMSNHYHMLLSTPDSNIDQIMRYFQSEISKEVHKLTGTQTYRFQGRYKWKIIKDSAHYLLAHRYLFRNPVEAKIVKRAEDYPYSTLHGQAGLATLKIPIYEACEFNLFLGDNLDERIDLLNEAS